MIILFVFNLFFSLDNTYIDACTLLASGREENSCWSRPNRYREYPGSRNWKKSHGPIKEFTQSFHLLYKNQCQKIKNKLNKKKKKKKTPILFIEFFFFLGCIYELTLMKSNNPPPLHWARVWFRITSLDSKRTITMDIKINILLCMYIYIYIYNL